MAKSKKCTYCSHRKGKRKCPALEGPVCTLCCGQHRHSDIDCPDDCVYLWHEEYQAERQAEQEVSRAAQAVAPPVLGYEVLAVSVKASEFTYKLEHNFAHSYVEGADIRDEDVLKALRAVYFSVYRERDYPTSHHFSTFLVDMVRTHLRPQFEKDVPADLQEKIILRLMLSVKNISGGPFGPCGYLNYVKNNILHKAPDGHFIAEDMYGNRQLKEIPE